MRRNILTAGVTIALLFAGSLGFIAWRTGAAAPAKAPLTASAAALAPEAVADLPAAVTRSPAPAEPSIATTAKTGTPALDNSIRPGVSGKARGEAMLRPPSRAVAKSLRRQLNDGSGNLRATLARCATAGEPLRRPAILMLKLETLDGKVRIVDAPIHTKGDASDALVACAQGVLRNQTIPAPAARPGSRNQLPLALAFYEKR
jgi:hypothetical protein